MNKTDEQIAISADSKNQSAIKAFYELVKSYSHKNSKTNTNFVFFVGAGFSKAWDENFYGGRDLFETFSREHLSFTKSLIDYLQTMSWHGPEILHKDEFKIKFNDFKKIVFSLGMYEKYGELRPKYIDSKGLKIIREELNALIALKIWEHNPYSQKANSYTPMVYPSGEPTKEQKDIVKFFNTLRYQKNNSSLEQEGIKINHITTNYDFVIESIFDAWANEYSDVSHLDYAYRGFTPSEYCGFSEFYTIEDDPITQCYNQSESIGYSNISKIKDYKAIESLFKLNGGLEIYRNSDGTYKIDYGKKENKDLLEKSPLLILPSYEQDYSDSYFREILQKSKELLTTSKVLIIIGYSLPEEDILIRFLLKHFALDKTDFQNKKIFYINKGKNHNELDESLTSVFRESINKSSQQIYTFSGSFNEFVEQFNQLWKDDNRPQPSDKKNAKGKDGEMS
ncbi:hypothetical protein R83H12_01190 [Fibrobacteria bacterium R8-3-H12]